MVMFLCFLWHFSKDARTDSGAFPSITIKLKGTSIVLYKSSTAFAKGEKRSKGTIITVKSFRLEKRSCPALPRVHSGKAFLVSVFVVMVFILLFYSALKNFRPKRLSYKI